MRLRLLNVVDVAESQTCCGCGACAYVEPGLIEMADVLDHGRRPVLRSHASATSTAPALGVCPAVRLAHPEHHPAGIDRELLPTWGPVLEVWEGYASDPEIRFAGSSGGAATALALFQIEQGGLHGLLHIAAREDVPYLNETVLSTTRQELLARTGSRYAPASPCDGLSMIEHAPGPCVFIGKPCDVAAAGKAAALRPALKARLGLTIGMFCAGTPSTRGTLEMLKVMGIEPDNTASIRYRGNGWPGDATAVAVDGRKARMSYSRSWGSILTRHVQWRCRICPDHTGEFADIAVGDPWYRPIAEGDAGRSLIVARTERGRRALHDAVAAGYLSAQRVDPKLLPASQPNLARARGAVWGRLLGLRFMGVATPSYQRIPMFHLWMSDLPLRDKVKSILGTMRRVIRKGLWRRAQLQPLPASVAVTAPTHPSAVAPADRLAVAAEV